jgi:hypothetical protein
MNPEVNTVTVSIVSDILPINFVGKPLSGSIGGDAAAAAGLVEAFLTALLRCIVTPALSVYNAILAEDIVSEPRVAPADPDVVFDIRSIPLEAVIVVPAGIFW